MLLLISKDVGHLEFSRSGHDLSLMFFQQAQNKSHGRHVFLVTSSDLRDCQQILFFYFV